MASKTYTTSEINDIYNARKVLIDILESRGFDTMGYNNFNVNEIQSMTENDQLDMLLSSKEEDGGEPIKKMFIKYHLTKLSNTAVYDIIDDLFSVDEIIGKKDELIIFVKDKPNVKIQQLVELIYKRDQISTKFYKKLAVLCISDSKFVHKRYECIHSFHWHCIINRCPHPAY